jgi:hypothetical protein
MKMRRTEQGEGYTRLGYRRTNPWEIRYQSGQRIPTIWTKNQISRMSGFLLRPITSGKVTDNQKDVMLVIGREPKPN